ncbi:hypothetical protein AAG906_003196 [Vitis piasezkii]
MGSDVVFDSLYLDRTDSVVFGLPGSFMDPHRFARSLSLTGCSLRRGHDRYLTEPPRSIQLGPHFLTLGCHHASPSGRPPPICMIIPNYGIRVGLRIRSHSVMTLRIPCFVSSGSHFLVLMWFPDGVVSGSWILASSFRRVHVGSSVHPHRVAHEAYFPRPAMEAFVLSHVRYSSHHSAWIYGIRLAGPLFLSSSSM